MERPLATLSGRLRRPTSAFGAEAHDRNRPVADFEHMPTMIGMHSTTAYERRTTLCLNELERLRVALADEVERYRIEIRGYTPEKMVQFGTPYLAKLEARVADV